MLRSYRARTPARLRPSPNSSNQTSNQLDVTVSDSLGPLNLERVWVGIGWSRKSPGGTALSGL
jgi:hypothetical protein